MSEEREYQFFKDFNTFDLMEKINNAAGIGLYMILGIHYKEIDKSINIYVYDNKTFFAIGNNVYYNKNYREYEKGYNFLKEEVKKISEENNITINIVVENNYNPFNYKN